MLKRDGRLFLRGLIPALLLAMLLIACCAAALVSAVNGAKQENVPLKVALTDNEDSVLSRISVSMVTGQDYVSSLMSIEQCDEKTALDGIKNGKYAAAVILPGGYMDSIMHGNDCKGKIYISDALKGEGEVIRAIADFGSRLVTAGQCGVFSGEYLVNSSPALSAYYTNYIEDSNTGLINFAVGAYDSVFTFEVLEYSNTGVSLTYYYLACWIVLVLFVCGLFFPDLYTTDCKGSIYARLRTCRISRFDFLAGKILYPFIFRVCILIPAALLLSSKAFLVLVIAAFFVTLMTSGISVALSKKGGWTVAILGITAACIFMAGGCLPRAMLPEVLSKIAAFTPFGVIQSIVIYALGGSFSKVQAVLCVAYAVAAIVVCLHFLQVLDTHSEEVRL